MCVCDISNGEPSVVDRVTQYHEVHVVHLTDQTILNLVVWQIIIANIYAIPKTRGYLVDETADIAFSRRRTNANFYRLCGDL